MMCEHEMTHLPFTEQKHCRNCGKSEREIDLESQLAAANARIAELTAENKRMRVCGNCRHFSAGYTGDYCVKDNCCGECETLRQNTCRDWEMV